MARLPAALALAALALTAGTASAAAPPPVKPHSRYLALGDSVVFGYQEKEVVPAPDYGDASSFLGYPEHLAQRLHLRLANASCPGETTESLIDETAQSNGCENALGTAAHYRYVYPLHVRYKHSQLDYAVAYLRKHPDTRLVSLMVGANDFFLCQKQTSDQCLDPSEQQAVLAKIQKNVHKIVKTIRRKARYRGQLVLVHYYSFDYSSELFNRLSREGNAAMDRGAKGFHARHADGFGEWQRGTERFGGSPCKAGLVTQLHGDKEGTCGVHPTYAGQGLLSDAVERILRL